MKELVHLPLTYRHQLRRVLFLTARLWRFSSSICEYSLLWTTMCIFRISLAARSCSRRHADCLAFIGGSVEALTGSVWLRSAVLCALDSTPSAPQRRASLFSSVFILLLPISPSPLCICSTLSAHLSKRTPLLAPPCWCRGEVKEVSHSEEEPAALFPTPPHRVL